MNLKKVISFMLAMLLVLSMAACTGEKNPSEVPEDTYTDPVESGDPDDTASESDPDVYVPETYPVDGLEEITVENPISYFALTVSENYEHFYTLNAYSNDDGTVTVEYVVDEKKVGKVASSVLHNLTVAFEESGLPALNGTMEYSDEPGYASMYVCYADGTVVAADCSGAVPQEFLEGYQAMEAYFRILTANIPLYVPAPQIMGSVNAAALEEMLLILNNTGMEALDTLAVSDVPLDEYFAFSVGLSGSEGIASGTSCSAMMMTTPYSVVIVTLENADDAAAVCQDFKSSMDWRKWVCVAPTNALIAQKGNMVLCLMGSDTMYSSTASAVKAAGWTEVEALKNPDM